jgi:DNA mismatch repair protein MutS
MMRQYLAIKAKYPEALVFYRMGDFYELFLNDAEVAAPLLDIALTTRDKGKPDAVPMCGVPVHGVEPHLKRLAELGHRVAICEQVEDAKAARAAGGKRLVRREVVEVVTPGLVGDPSGLAGDSEVQLAALWSDSGASAVAILEASTGEFRVVSEKSETSGQVPETLLDEIERIAPRELLAEAAVLEQIGDRVRAALPEISLSAVPARSFSSTPDGAQARVFEALEGLVAREPAEARAAAALLRFVDAHQPFAVAGLAPLKRYALNETMELDSATRRHLELFENSDDGSRRGTLFERIDKTATPLGARRLARWLAYPLLDLEALHARQAAVAFWFERDMARTSLRGALRPVRDLERILAKAARPGAGPRDLVALRRSVEGLREVALLCEAVASERRVDEVSAPGSPAHPIPGRCSEIAASIATSLVDDPAIVARGSRGALETGYIRPGYRADLDALRESADKGREWIAGLETQERTRTGIASLKVRFHPVHGYSLEVTKAQLERVPADYERRQTLANTERYTTPALREMETSVLGARERAAALERELFDALRAEVLKARVQISEAAQAVGSLDALATLAEVARRDAWVCPDLDRSGTLEIRAGRHPVVEPLVTARGEEFVANDTDLDPERRQILLLTGPNMSGKSTYLRQTALIALLAQIGSFVPAESARVGLVDRVFTRVGASDRLAQGESTFMVEMRETAEILARATRRSLIILDEIGRGTSTFDGLSIAWAVAEYLHEAKHLGARTLFATHYHELTELEASLPRLRNAHFAAREWGDDVVFLRRLEAGGANRSYGIQVARLAGLPASMLERAKAVLADLEARGATDPRRAQLGLFEQSRGTPGPSIAERDVLEALRRCDPDRMRPVDALDQLARWRRRLRDEPS